MDFIQDIILPIVHTESDIGLATLGLTSPQGNFNVYTSLRGTGQHQHG